MSAWSGFLLTVFTVFIITCGGVVGGFAMYWKSQADQMPAVAKGEYFRGRADAFTEYFGAKMAPMLVLKEDLEEKKKPAYDKKKGLQGGSQ